MHAVPLVFPARDLELREHDGELGVGGGVADVVLVGLGLHRGDHELARLGVVRRDRAERLHVGAVPGLGHREAAHQLPGDQVGEVLLVVPRRPELEDRPAEQPELDAHLDQHRQVAEGQGLEGRERRPDVTAAAVLLREAHAGLAGGRHLEDDLPDPLPERRPVEGLGLLEDRGVLDQVGAHQLAHLGVVAVEQRGQRLDVDRRLDVAGRLGLGRRRLPAGVLAGLLVRGAVVSLATTRGYPAAAPSTWGRTRGGQRVASATGPTASASERAPRSARCPRRTGEAPRSGRAKRGSVVGPGPKLAGVKATGARSSWG